MKRDDVRRLFERAERLKPNVPDLLNRLGVEYRKAGREWRGHCPEPNHARRRGPGSWQIAPTGQHHCFACGFGGGVLALVQTVQQVNRLEAAQWLLEQFGDELDPNSEVRIAEMSFKVPAPLELRVPTSEPLWVPRRQLTYDARRAFDYLRGRGVTEDEIRRHAMRATQDADLVAYRGRVIVPVTVRGRLVDFVARLYVAAEPETPKALSGLRKLGARKELVLWNYDRLEPRADTVYIAEGVWGALAVIRAGFSNTVSTCGSAWSPERTQLLSGYRNVVLIPDADAAGAAMVGRVSGLRFDHQIWLARLPDKSQPDGVDPAALAKIIQSAQRIQHFGPMSDFEVLPSTSSKFGLR